MKTKTYLYIKVGILCLLTSAWLVFCSRMPDWQETSPAPYVEELSSEYGIDLPNAGNAGVTIRAAAERWGGGEFVILRVDANANDLASLKDSFKRSTIVLRDENIAESLNVLRINKDILWWPQEPKVLGQHYGRSPKELNVQLLTVFVLENESSILFSMTPKKQYLMRNGSSR